MVGDESGRTVGSGVFCDDAGAESVRFSVAITGKSDMKRSGIDLVV